MIKCDCYNKVLHVLTEIIMNDENLQGENNDTK